MLWKRAFAGCAVAALALALTACGQTEQASVAPPEETPATEAPAPDDDVAEAPSAYPFCAEIGRRVPPQQCEDFGRLADDAQAGAAAFNTPDPMKRGERHTLQLAIGFAPTPEQIAERERLAREATALAARQAELDRLAREREAAEQDAREVDAHQEGPSEPAEPPQPPAAAPPPPPPTPAETVDPLQGETVEFQPLVGRFMRAELTGAGFNITALSPPSQEVLQDSVTTWTWDVIAEQGGQRALTLTTVVEGCTAEGPCYPLRSTSQNYEVNVTVGWLGKVQDFLTAAPDWLKLITGALVAMAALVAAGFGLRNALRGGRQG